MKYNEKKLYCHLKAKKIKKITQNTKNDNIFEEDSVL
jgi:hypothetical protein